MIVVPRPTHHQQHDACWRRCRQAASRRDAATARLAGVNRLDAHAEQRQRHQCRDRQRAERQIIGHGPEGRTPKNACHRAAMACVERTHGACGMRALLLFGRLLPRPRPAARRLGLGGLRPSAGLASNSGGGLLGGALRGFRRLELARARFSATSAPPLARNSASSGERATSAVISTVTSGWRWTLILCAPSALDRLVELDLAALDLDAGGGGAVGDVARGHRTVELQRLGRLADEGDLEVAHLAGDRFGLAGGARGSGPPASYAAIQK